MNSGVIFDDKDKDYCLFKPAITDRGQIREIVESHPAVSAENKKMDTALEAWWESARVAIEALPHHNQVAKFRRESIGKLKNQLAATGILDEFQRAGVFVNWWEVVRWDMKAIVTIGWSPSLIPDDYIKNAFFKKELSELDALESKASGMESDVAEILDEIEMDENGEEENGKTLKSAKSYLKEQIGDLQEAGTEGAQKEKVAFETVLNRLDTKEKELKAMKKLIKTKAEELGRRLEDKRATFTEVDAKGLILAKFNDLARNVMFRYLNSRKRSIIGTFENLWDKYHAPLTAITESRDEASKRLNAFIKELGYGV